MGRSVWSRRKRAFHLQDRHRSPHGQPRQRSLETVIMKPSGLPRGRDSAAAARCAPITSARIANARRLPNLRRKRKKLRHCWRRVIGKFRHRQFGPHRRAHIQWAAVAATLHYVTNYTSRTGCARPQFIRNRRRRKATVGPRRWIGPCALSARVSVGEALSLRKAR